MDSITHIALGACIGEALFGKQLGKKAWVWGAIAQSLPDLDVAAHLWMPLPQELLAHRGITHSLVCILIMSPLLALLARNIHKAVQLSWKNWTVFFALELGMHIFLDSFNNYGTGWLEPFSQQRFSFNSIYVADPFFSLPAIVGAFVLLLGAPTYRYRKLWCTLGICLPLMYLGYCVVNKINMDREVRQIFAARKIPSSSYFTTPAPLNNWLWFVVSGDGHGYYIGYRSVFDSKTDMDFTYFPKNDSLLSGNSNIQELPYLQRFSQMFYTVEKRGDSLVFNDLRFGQIIGWKDPHEKFVFHYFLQPSDANDLVVQRGRFARWDKNAAVAMWERIKGN